MLKNLFLTDPFQNIELRVQNKLPKKIKNKIYKILKDGFEADERQEMMAVLNGRRSVCIKNSRNLNFPKWVNTKDCEMIVTCNYN